MARKKKKDRAEWDQGGMPWARLAPPLDDIRVDFRTGYWLLPPLQPTSEEVAKGARGGTIRLKRRLGKWSLPQEGDEPDLPLDDVFNAAVEEAFQDYLRHHNPKRSRCPRCDEKPGCSWCAVEAAGGSVEIRREIAEVADDPDAVIEVLTRLGLVPKEAA